jgi:hypothetical protein
VPSRKSDYIRTKPHFTTVERPEQNSHSALNQTLDDLLNNSIYSNSDSAVLDANSNYLKKKPSSKFANDGSDNEDGFSSTADSFLTSHLGYLNSTQDDDDNESSYNGYIDLNGPYSPLEVNYFSIVNVGHCKRTRVERDSINYVTLDDDPYNECTRLMIAAEITLNSTGQSMLLRKTTSMPKLPGLSSICCLLFSPQVEFRVDPRKKLYTGALCGLGYDQEGAIYTDNDIECAFDIEIDLNDIKHVKKNLFFKLNLFDLI